MPDNADKLNLIPRDAGKAGWRFCWITDFPLFDATEDGHLVAAHHPFTSPHADDIDKLESDPGAVRARAYDLVLNGNEIAGGSIRIFADTLWRDGAKEPEYHAAAAVETAGRHA